MQNERCNLDRPLPSAQPGAVESAAPNAMQAASSGQVPGSQLKTVQ
jgi:hypothetical protein